MIEILVTYISIWLPSLVSVLSSVGVVFIALGKMNDINKNQLLKELSDKLTTALNENEDIKLQNSLLLDELTKIKDYAKAIKKERK